jgi:hypothetical protein
LIGRYQDLEALFSRSGQQHAIREIDLAYRRGTNNIVSGQPPRQRGRDGLTDQNPGHV